MSKFVMKVDGMTCDSCNVHVGRALERTGASQVVADWRRGEARFDLARDIAHESLAAAVSDAGYEPGEIRALETDASKRVSTSSGDAYDLVVIGAGSAAFAAAIKARDQGARVAVVDRGTIGGTCVNIGCVPSKALLRAAEIYHAASHHPYAGVETSAGTVDLAALVAQKDELVTMLRQEKYENVRTAIGFDFIAGEARFMDSETIAVDGTPLKAGSYLIATGASPAIPPIPGLAELEYLTSTSALDLKELPETLAVIGANAIGLELGQFFLHLGVHVTFFDVMARIAPFEEPEISAALADVLRDQGATIHAPSQIAGVHGDGSKRVVDVTLEDGTTQKLSFDQILVATGRRPNTAALNAQAAGITLDARGAIIVDEYLRTTNPKVFAAGDVTPAPQFVYVAAYEGSLAAQNALGETQAKVDFLALPRVTFTTPQVAAAGLTEEAARAAGYAVKSSTLPLSAVPRALVNRDTRGLIKIVADASTDKVLGVHVLAESAGEVLQAGIYAIKFGLTVADIAGTWHSYLTMAEGLKLAAQTFTRDIKHLSCCAA